MEINWPSLRISFVLCSVAILLSACGDDPCSNSSFTPSKNLNLRSLEEVQGESTTLRDNNGAPVAIDPGACTDIGRLEPTTSNSSENDEFDNDIFR